MVVGHRERRELYAEAFQRIAGAFLPKPVRDVFLAKTPLLSETTAFQLAQKPHLTEISLSDVQSLYEVPNFVYDLRKYILGAGGSQGTNLPFESIRSWWRVRLQLRDPQDPTQVLPPLTVQACPPTERGDNAIYNFVLLRNDETARFNTRNDFGLGSESILESYRFNLLLNRNLRLQGCTIEGRLFSQLLR